MGPTVLERISNFLADGILDLNQQVTLICAVVAEFEKQFEVLMEVN